MSEFLTLEEAAQLLGRKPQVLRRLVYSGAIAAARGKNHALLFARSEVERIKAMRYPEGMSHTDIAQHYGVSRGHVIYHFQRLRVKPLNPGRFRLVYDEATIAKFAGILGWSESPGEDQVAKNPPDESSAHTRAT